ncbi:MAG TPA: glutamine--tRNA ligase/YqeY domain fusion protein [candidate division Zixibacteria bacterium]|nr:glutamine--tRNA ligase/YqeY domain fusion protein [candidate division Zixibacteria bacterium]MDD4916793.1 glutamine--tRNA ligase/YqeY domain fusion protein [candidate division Zixibacteria bacterium]MDM7972406.1 glutamine--tRNA ligase/YqeY domain fusion protein [candidate division Zixibacteria bacterium]HOD66132.1 glutamine--tRNA ligase/YqeY domain fusion protein [candidate division Zixibacteria bacterium]HOZ08618.1 glutamine--tRNA ligase/YqeY domain fusion protein [candidate division Zixiba
MASDERATSNFIRDIIDDDLAKGTYDGRVHTRFPPEPNGYLHIGHAKSILLNYGLAQTYGGKFNLRFDDTNPTKEEEEYVNSIIEDVRWLGADWEDRLFFASDYFPQLYEWAVQLIKAGKAYVDDLTPEEIRATRGTLTEPGQESPFRNRPIEENLDLFERMKNGEFPNGAKTLRAKIDMGAGNVNLRDPVMYRVLHARHHRTGDAWCIYPMYDWAHGQSDSVEGITHSICTLEFEDHRPLYNWFLDQLGIYHPRQIEFARLDLTYTVMSKRKLLRLVQEKYVDGWDDPRMPTISGLRRRGYTPESLRDFAERVGVAKKKGSVADLALLEHCLRDDLNKRARRVMAVLDPLKVVITNYPEDRVEEIEAVNNPENAAEGTRMVPFAREIYIERDDFMEHPPAKFFRLSPGAEVRLKHAYFIRCQEAVKDAAGKIVELRCTYDPASRGGEAPDGRKVKGTLHWVSAAHAFEGEVRWYENLFSNEFPEEIAPEEAAAGKDFTAHINPHSLRILTGCRLEPMLKEARPGDRFQFLRHGYFCVDNKFSAPGRPIFNRTVGLRDTWAKLAAKD